MCGIIACLSSQSVKSIVSGINQLQNRGNDSYGLTILNGQHFVTHKFS